MCDCSLCVNYPELSCDSPVFCGFSNDLRKLDPAKVNFCRSPSLLYASLREKLTKRRQSPAEERTLTRVAVTQCMPGGATPT